MTDDHDEITISNLLSRMDAGWDELQAFIKPLSEEAMTVSVDAAGWTVKDHLIHLAIWEGSMIALLNHQPRYEALGVDYDLFVSGDHDAVNAIIQQQHKDKSPEQVLAELEQTHTRMLQKIQSLTDADIALPYQHYAPDADRDAPVVYWIVGNTSEHYAEHTPWMMAILEQ